MKDVDGTRPGGYDRAIKSNDPLVSFLYTLGRDELSLGIIFEHAENAANHPDSDFSNDGLALFAIQMANRLSGISREKSLELALSELKKAQEW